MRVMPLPSHLQERACRLPVGCAGVIAADVDGEKGRALFYDLFVDILLRMFLKIRTVGLNQLFVP
jgi:hypothetical protein